MVFTINSAEAQSMQEDEAQLIAAIAQAARGITAALNPFQVAIPAAQATEPRGLHIQMGRRLVYGQMANGQFRHQLDANCLKVIFDAVQRPVAEGTDPEQYRGKVPAIEIRDNGILLFREERDGVVTANEIQFQVEPSVLQQEPASAQPQPEPITAPEPSQLGASAPATRQADDIAQIADYLLNPLAGEPIYDAVSIGEYCLKRGGNSLTVSRGDSLILVARQGEVITDHVTQQDWETFQRIEQQSCPYPFYQIDWNTQVPLEKAEAELPHEYSTLYELWDSLERMTASELLSVATQQFGLYPDGKDPIELEHSILGRYSVIQDILTTYKIEQGIDSIPEDNLEKSLQEDTVAEPTAAPESANVATHEEVPPAIAVAEREASRLPECAIRQFLQVTIQNWKQQLGQNLSNKLQSSVNWLKNSSGYWRNQQIAHTAVKLFNRGYSRTSERSYQVDRYTVSYRGRDTYTLRDAKGELLRFRVSRSLIPGVRSPAVRVLSASDRLSELDYRELKTMQRDQTVTPQGDLDVEANYAAKTNRVEQTVVQFLQSQVKAKVWDKEGGRFRLEIGTGGFLCITDKQEGRGVVFQRKDGEVFSRLNASDFAHFERLANRMQQVKQPLSPQPQPELNGHSRAKVALEME